MPVRIEAVRADGLACGIRLSQKKLRAAKRQSISKPKIRRGSTSGFRTGGGSKTTSPIIKSTSPIFPRVQERSDGPLDDSAEEPAEDGSNVVSVQQGGSGRGGGGQGEGQSGRAGRSLTSFELEADTPRKTFTVKGDMHGGHSVSLGSRLLELIGVAWSELRVATGVDKEAYGGKASTEELVLWRGMRGVQATDAFVEHGGSELAPCSTTPNLEIAVRYAKEWHSDTAQDEKALIFRVLVEDFMNRGPGLGFLSAFPHEQEALCAAQSRPADPASAAYEHCLSLCHCLYHNNH